MDDSLVSCPMCGGPAVVHSNPLGTSYYIPMSEEAFQKTLDSDQLDWFMRDRLRRVETIIIDLRKQVKELQSGNQSRDEVSGS